MLYDITLAIRYDYDSPARAARTVLRMLPLTRPGQRLVSGLVESLPGPDHRIDGTDFFGNAMTQIAFDSALSEVTFRFAGRVQRDDAEGLMDLSCPLRDLGREATAELSLAPEAPHHYLGASDRVRPSTEITAFAEGVTEPGQSTLAAVEAVSRALHGAFEFDPTATEVTTDPVEAFRARRGVCQDISHVMIAALRGIGVPAGYVSGFLRTVPPEGTARLEGADAMHAWVRAWCGQETGWIEIDPTNDMHAGADHVAVALGRDYADVAPVKGSLRSAGPHTTEHSVDVVPVNGPVPGKGATGTGRQ